MNQLGNMELKNNDSSSWLCRDSKGNVQALIWDFTNTHPGDSVHNQKYYIQDLPAKPKGTLKVRLENVPAGMYALELYKVGYKCNDAYSTYLSLGRPAQLSSRQVSAIKNLNDGAPILKEIVEIKNGIPFSKDWDIRENDVFLLQLVKL